MKAFIKSIVLGGLFIFMVASPVMATATPQTVSAKECESSVLGIIPWYRGLTNQDDACSMKTPEDLGGLSNYIWRIVLNGIQIAISIAAYIAFFFILYGGFQFMTGGGNPGQVESARKTLLNAVIGLVIALGSTAIINLVFTVID